MESKLENLKELTATEFLVIYKRFSKVEGEVWDHCKNLGGEVGRLPPVVKLKT